MKIVGQDCKTLSWYHTSLSQQFLKLSIWPFYPSRRRPISCLENIWKGGATIAMTNFVGLSTSLIVKHGVFDCTPEVISGPETTSACWLMSCTGPATSSASSPSTNILPALQITNQTLLLFQRLTHACGSWTSQSRLRGRLSSSFCPWRTDQNLSWRWCQSNEALIESFICI